ncbi:RNA polymerase sigma factor [Streptomyces sp.]|uniref:RNA polymerase sigma factor n=1 Tax=Streptomyces sp. TaxID=1931 RepID=UPI002F415AF4
MQTSTDARQDCCHAGPSDPRPDPGRRTGPYDGTYAPLRPLLAAEAAAEAPPGAGIEADDLEQAVWLRLLELGSPPAEPGHWVRRAVRAEARAAALRSRGELSYDDPAGGGPPVAYPGGVEDEVVTAEQLRTVRTAVRLLPGRCPQLVAAMMSSSDPTYREISRELGISQGSLGPLRSRCFGCLRTILNSRVGSPVGRGKAR